MPSNSIILSLLKSRFCPRYDYDMLDIPTDPNRTIQFVEFSYNCSANLKAFAWLWGDNSYTDIRYFSKAPCRWELNRKVQHLMLISNMQLQSDCIQTSVEYEAPAKE